MSIRTLDALQNMAKTANSKVVFVPMVRTFCCFRNVVLSEQPTDESSFISRLMQNTSNMGQLNPGQGAPAFEMGYVPQSLAFRSSSC